MSTKIEQTSGVEYGNVNSATPTSSGASTSSPRISKFAVKAGFVLPKNKLSGSLVPITRDNKNPVGSDVANEEINKQVQRKTKWGPDATQDASVRKGKALAYQTRVDQIMKQLNSGIMDFEDEPSLTSQISGLKSSSHGLNTEKSELLVLERREAIGEILKLNPNYKAPADYKPVLREAKVPIPINDYPGYNFLTLVFGSASDTQKRLEKETGAKIRVFGAKANAGKKEVTADDMDNQSLYEDLYVHTSADTYEKVDAAVSLIELLITPVSVHHVAVSATSTAVSSNNMNVIGTGQGTPIPHMVPSPFVNQGYAQPITGSVQTQPSGQFQPYPGSWLPTSSHLGFVTQNSSTPTLSSPAQMSSTSLNASNAPSLFGPRPAGIGSAVLNPSFNPSMPQPVLQQAYMSQAPSPGYIGLSRNPTISVLQPNSSHLHIAGQPPTSSNQHTPSGPPQAIVSLTPQTASPATFVVRSVTHFGSSIGWSQAPAGPSNMGPVSLPIVPPQRPHPVASQSIVVAGAPPFNNNTSSNMVSPKISQFQPSAWSSGPAFSLVQPGMAFAPTSSTSAPSATMTRAMVPPISLSLLPQSGVQSFAGSAGPSATGPKPPHPSSNDFTFQPHRPQSPASLMAPRPNFQTAPHSMLSRSLAMHPQAPQVSSFLRPVQNSVPSPVMQDFAGPQGGGQMNQPWAQMSPGNLNSPHGPPRHPGFPNPGPVSPATPGPQMGIRSYSPGPQAMNAPVPFAFRPGNPIQLQQNYPPTQIRSRGNFSPNQQFRGGQPFSSGNPLSNSFAGQQNYDPFSPTSVPLRPQLGANPSQPRKQENDPEYEDLMASAGVK